uniref:small RNA 2'-O-methyltransferase isoform X1 n=1 Tax=Oncorhynchus gorbuscha TaxID=8017 RepID=UPI001EAF5ED4|nr:small RNA 2'-O-methyltransferase isoform X1 [Oncorhynchus gorbuscha]XP_046156230.1 small RNA 2'-O-methyltransferase isoform X2 [Oncorhynchus gorbuscha]
MNTIFTPPLYIQRYEFVIDFVKKNKPKKVVDLGCNDCTLLRKLKFHKEIELLAGLDIDCAVIRAKMYELAPIPTDYLQPGDHPLTIELYQGSVTERDPRTKGFDLVTSIELIEHLQLEDVDRFTEVVFGYMAPVAAIISTPNADFNPLLPGLTGFRHYDHKFEWTKVEFQTWALKVCKEFGYVVVFTGVGQIPAQEESIGFCSQIGVFQIDRSGGDAPRLQNNVAEEHLPYRVLYNVVYPSLCDSNIFQRTLVNEVLYWAETLKREWLEEIRGVGDEESEQTDEEGCSREGMDREESQTGEVERVEARGRGFEVENEEVGREGRTDMGQEEPYREGQSVCVPLVRLCSYPRVQALSGTVQRLTKFLLENSRVQLTNDGTAVVLVDSDDEDLEWDENCDNTGTGPFFVSSVENEDWETELGQ